MICGLAASGSQCTRQSETGIIRAAYSGDWWSNRDECFKAHGLSNSTIHIRRLGSQTLDSSI